jgi:hypothetical protein
MSKTSQPNEPMQLINLANGRTEEISAGIKPLNPDDSDKQHIYIVGLANEAGCIDLAEALDPDSSTKLFAFTANTPNLQDALASNSTPSRWRNQERLHETEQFLSLIIEQWKSNDCKAFGFWVGRYKKNSLPTGVVAGRFGDSLKEESRD